RHTLFLFLVVFLTSFSIESYFSHIKFRLFLILNSTAFLLWNLLWEFTIIVGMKFILTVCSREGGDHLKRQTRQSAPRTSAKPKRAETGHI
ncbi:MAG: hypothetical protein IJW99_06930, partial [Clostridia bacterium]|nr:hypothetical protein [Clostridia bacterium]